MLGVGQQQDGRLQRLRMNGRCREVGAWATAAPCTICSCKPGIVANKQVEDQHRVHSLAYWPVMLG